MKASLKHIKRSTRLVNQARLRRLLRFVFPFFTGTVVTDAFRVRNRVNKGEIIVSQRRGAGSTTTPVIRYQIVDAVTGRPVTNSVTVTGVVTVRLHFVVPAGTFRLRITNVGAQAAAVQGVIVIL